MTTYLSYDVLDQRTNAREASNDSLPRLISVLDPGIGKAHRFARDRAPKAPHQYQWTCKTRAEIQALKTWFAARRGVVVPFWVPTWRRDMELALPVAALDTGITIENHGYTKLMYDPTNARKRIAFFVPATGALIYRQVTDWHLVGATEVLTLDAAVGISLPLRALISFLTFCRLSSDDLKISYLSDSIAECSFSYVEIPEETP
jgi:hypothetical protein